MQKVNIISLNFTINSSTQKVVNYGNRALFMSMNSVANNFKACYNQVYLKRYFRRKKKIFKFHFLNHGPTRKKGEFLCRLVTVTNSSYQFDL